MLEDEKFSMICDDVDWQSFYTLNQYALKSEGNKKDAWKCFGLQFFWLGTSSNRYQESALEIGVGNKYQNPEMVVSVSSWLGANGVDTPRVKTC